MGWSWFFRRLSLPQDGHRASGPHWLLPYQDEADFHLEPTLVDERILERRIQALGPEGAVARDVLRQRPHNFEGTSWPGGSVDSSSASQGVDGRMLEEGNPPRALGGEGSSPK